MEQYGGKLSEYDYKKSIEKLQTAEKTGISVEQFDNLCDAYYDNMS